MSLVDGRGLQPGLSDGLRKSALRLAAQLEQLYVLGTPRGDEALRIAMELRHFLDDQRLDRRKP